MYRRLPTLIFVQIKSQFALHDWQAKFEESQKRDREEYITYLAEIDRKADFIQEIVMNTNSRVIEWMSMVQMVRH